MKTTPQGVPNYSIAIILIKVSNKLKDLAHIIPMCTRPCADLINRIFADQQFEAFRAAKLIQ